MNNNKIKKWIFNVGLMLSVLFFMAVKCNHKDKFIGPEYREASSGFQALANLSIVNRAGTPVTSVSLGSPTKDTVFFNATFNDRVTWFIDLKGLTSGAKKRFTGLSGDLQSQKNLYWTGTADDIVMFYKGEKVEATLSFMGTNLTYKDTVTITTTRTYSNVIKTVNDFEGVVKKTSLNPANPNGYPTYIPNNGAAPYWYPVAQDTSGAEFNYLGVINDLSILLADHNRSPNGTHYVLLDGVDTQKKYFIGGMGFTGKTSKVLPAIYTNPDSIYFNIYVYGFGNSNTQFQVAFDENEKGLPDFDALSEDEWDYAMIVNWVGWRLVSFKYSQTTVGVAPNGGNGNHILEPNKITKMGFTMNSNPNGGAAKVAFDYPVFTYGAPFDPNK